MKQDLLTPRQHNLKLLRTADLRQAEATAYKQIPSFTLMARAGAAAWQWALALCAGDTRPWLVLAGTGNNGGDAFVLAKQAHLAGLKVAVHATGATGEAASDALRARTELEAAGVAILPSEQLQSIDGGQWACIVDGMLGIGARNPPSGETARLIELANSAKHARTLALDIPSGLDADTGVAATPCIHASHTISFIAAKPGLLTADGPDVCGHVRIAPLDLDEATLTENASAWATNEGMVALADTSLRSSWPARRLNSHKGTAGDVIIIGGDTGMAGAAILAGRAAVQMGAGRVFLGLLDGPHPPGYDPVAPEMMLRQAESLLGHPGVWVLGPGCGQTERMQVLLRQLLRQWHDAPETAPKALVLDADALNLVAADPALAVRLQSLKTMRIITPHPLEAARLLARSTSAVQADRLAAADALARQLDAVVVLKGMGSVISDGRTRLINASGGPALASGGTGDVLAGTVGAVLAQMTGASDSQQTSAQTPQSVKTLETPALRAAALAAWLHGAACDALPGEISPPTLLCASELPARMRRILMQ